MKKVTKHITVSDETIDAGDPYVIVDPVWWSVVTDKGQAGYGESLKRFSIEQRYLAALVWYLSEVNNGGHDQFFFNSAGIVWQDVMAWYRAVGFEEAAGILEDAARRIGGNPSLDWFTRQEQLEEFDADLEDLDTRFYSLQNTGAFDEQMMNYIRSHRAAFYFDGMVEMFEL
jgi:hypothetical protein